MCCRCGDVLCATLYAGTCPRKVWDACWRLCRVGSACWRCWSVGGNAWSFPKLPEATRCVLLCMEAKDVDDLTPLLYAAKNGHEAVVKVLLENGAELEAKDVDNLTSLLYAAIYGHEAVVTLLEKGADLKTKSM